MTNSLPSQKWTADGSSFLIFTVRIILIRVCCSLRCCEELGRRGTCLLCNDNYIAVRTAPRHALVRNQPPSRCRTTFFNPLVCPVVRGRWLTLSLLLFFFFYNLIKNDVNSSVRAKRCLKSLFSCRTKSPVQTCHTLTFDRRSCWTFFF